MIEPTVGRIVLYHPHADDGGDPNGQPHAAIVAHVHGPRMVNLTVFNENGSIYARRSVVLLQDDDANPGHDYAEWMPFQKGQAAKAEAAESPLLARFEELQKSVDAKLQELGDWTVNKITEIDAKLANPLLVAPEAPLQSAGEPAPPPQEPPQAAPEAIA